jgi:hypothetical protein
MTRLSFKIGAAAALALCAMMGAAQAGGDLDDSDNGYRRHSLSSLCDRHPDDARCEPSPARRYRPRPAPSYGYDRACGPTVRAAGKRNLIPAFARNSALFSWQREVRAVHGASYSSWSNARRAQISCGPAGGALTGCVATASPCRS